VEIWLSELIAKRETDSPPSDPEIDAAFRELAQTLSREVVNAQEAPGSDSYGGLEHRIAATRRDLGKSVRGLTRKEMWKVIVKLREGVPLVDADKILIRLWLIGDAEAYLKEEQNLKDWQRELGRLRGEIEAMSSAKASAENFQALQALLEEAHNVVINISRFYNERERIERFERTMSDRMDERERNLLADVLVNAYQAHGD
jgi:hypothetical protein